MVRYSCVLGVMESDYSGGPGKHDIHSIGSFPKSGHSSNESGGLGNVVHLLMFG